MMKTIDYEARKRDILAAAIDTYIEKAAPVSSDVLVKDYNFDLSPATIRNVLADLEELGFLTHPHTSAGRVPTEKGYRYYVNYLMKKIKLLDNERNRIESEYKKSMKELEKIFDTTSEVLSDFTHCTGLVYAADLHDRLFYKGTTFMLDQPEFNNLEKIRHVLKMLEEKQRLIDIISQELDKKIEIFIGSELHCDDINDCSLVVSSYKHRNKPSGRVAVLGPKRMQYSKVVSAVEYLSDLITEMLNDF
jgi:heat-inducible transcriptional repressor